MFPPGTGAALRRRLADADYVLIGRLLAAAIIIAGTILAYFARDDVFYDLHVGWQPELREFLGGSLQYLWPGGLLLAVTELGARLSGDDRDLPAPWSIANLVRLLGVVIVLGGALYYFWYTLAFHAQVGEIDSVTSVRGFFTLELRTYLWQGALIILLATLADYIRPPADDEDLGEAPTLAPPDDTPVSS